MTPFDHSSYAARLATEQSIYHDCLDVHELPGIFHYWSERYVRPKLEALGFSSPNEMLLKYAAERCGRGGGPKRVASIGPGNCELEIELASRLRAVGCGDFAIECLELNTAMLERGRAAAKEAGVDGFLNFLPTDLNQWSASAEYDVVIANEALHHILNLENLFDQIRHSLKPGGAFVTSDMIGRNGHQRWPEALDIVQEFWRKLPPSYRFNRRFQRYEEAFEDWDCSIGNFEGIRAQDILPLLLDRFHFELFVAYANVIDPFVDRTYGGNFDAAASWDRGFIDQVQARDEQEIASGRIKPTHMLAVLGKDPGVPTVVRDSLTPQFCLRDPSRVVVSAAVPAGYDWDWPHSANSELEIACRHLNATAEQRRQSDRRLEESNGVIEARTAWALSLDREIAEARRIIDDLQKELEDRSAWALGLDRELKSRTEWALRLDQELNQAWQMVRQLDQDLQESTGWAFDLDQQLTKAAHAPPLAELIARLAWALPLDRRFHKILDRVYRLVRRMRGRKME